VYRTHLMQWSAHPSLGMRWLPQEGDWISCLIEIGYCVRTVVDEWARSPVDRICLDLNRTFTKCYRAQTRNTIGSDRMGLESLSVACPLLGLRSGPPSILGLTMKRDRRLLDV